MKYLRFLSIALVIAAVSGCDEPAPNPAVDPALCGNGHLDAGEICDGTQYDPASASCPEGQIVVDPSRIVCSGCTELDLAPACGIKSVCGNGVIETDEKCDGEIIPDALKVCPAGMVPGENPVWKCSSCTSIDYSSACIKACGNGQIDGSEVCDGELIPDALKTCPADMMPKDGAVWKCNETCSAVDNSQACENRCGNGRIDDGEVCDGDNVPDALKACPEDMHQKDNAVWKCNAMCSGIDTAGACIAKKCGDGKIDDGEACDGGNVPESMKKCPDGMRVRKNSIWKCNESCTDADYASVCEVTCGNGKIDADLGEVCEENNVPESARKCPEGMTVKENPVWNCSTGCMQIDILQACDVAEPKCGDGKLDNGETCDGEIIPDAVKVCPPGMSLNDAPVWKCGDTCTEVIHTDACVQTCGNGQLDASEACEKNSIPSQAKKCPKGMSVKENPVWQCSSTCDGIIAAYACEIAKTCGNGKIDDGEVCDGENVPEALKVCPNGLPTVENPVWKCNETCTAVDQASVCRVSMTCGDGTINSGEICDGDKLPESAKVCPENMKAAESPAWKCAPTCGGIVIEDACVSLCGDGLLNGSEFCDGSAFDKHKVSDLKSSACGTGLMLNTKKLGCNECQIDFSNACTGNEGLIFSEIVTSITQKAVNDRKGGLVVEIANLGDAPVNVENHIIAVNGTALSYKLGTINIKEIPANGAKTVCMQFGGHKFGDMCDAVIDDDNIIIYLADFLLALLKDAAGTPPKYLSLKNAEDLDYTDNVNLKDLLMKAFTGVENFTRDCDALPHIYEKDAQMTDGWHQNADKTGAPKYGLGQHCPIL